MPQTRQQLERQLASAQTDLDTFAEKLSANGIDTSEHAFEPKWRSLNSRCGKLKARIRAVAVVEAREAEAAQRKSPDANQ